MATPANRELQRVMLLTHTMVMSSEKLVNLVVLRFNAVPKSQVSRGEGRKKRGGGGVVVAWRASLSACVRACVRPCLRWKEGGVYGGGYGFFKKIVRARLAFGRSTGCWFGFSPPLASAAMTGRRRVRLT